MATQKSSEHNSISPVHFLRWDLIMEDHLPRSSHRICFLLRVFSTPPFQLKESLWFTGYFHLPARSLLGEAPELMATENRLRCHLCARCSLLFQPILVSLGKHRASRLLLHQKTKSLTKKEAAGTGDLLTLLSIPSPSTFDVFSSIAAVPSSLQSLQGTAWAGGARHLWVNTRKCQRFRAVLLRKAWIPVAPKPWDKPKEQLWNSRRPDVARRGPAAWVPSLENKSGIGPFPAQGSPEPLR